MRDLYDFIFLMQNKAVPKFYNIPQQGVFLNRKAKTYVPYKFTDS